MRSTIGILLLSAALLAMSASAEAQCTTENRAPAFTTPTGLCGSVINVFVGERVSFVISAADSDEVDLVVLSTTGLPSGATMEPALPDTANPVSSEFSWTPAIADTGEHVVTFVAADTCAASAECIVTLRVTDNQPPDCSKARVASEKLWPPNHRWSTVEILGLEDPDGDSVHVEIVGVTQNEAVGAAGSGGTCPDARIGDDGQVQVRVERSGQGNGRVYRIAFLASDDGGGVCEGVVTVCVPHDRGRGSDCGEWDDDFEGYISTEACDDDPEDSDEEVTLRVSTAHDGVATIRYSIPVETDALLAVYDVAGRRLATIERGRMSPGARTLSWSTGGLRRGMYFVRLRAGETAVAKRLMVIEP